MQLQAAAKKFTSIIKHTGDTRKQPVALIGITVPNGAVESAIMRTGGTPVSFNPRVHDYGKWLQSLNGLVIPGGLDVHPALYRRKRHSTSTADDEMLRDTWELWCVKYALRHNIPVLGICRGHQLLNVALDGTLHQDIPNHWGNQHRTIIKDEQFAEMLGEKPGDAIWTNSIHHQAINRVGRNLRVAARSVDGTVEAVVHNKHPFAVGIQSHPEFAASMHATSLLKSFVMAARVDELPPAPLVKQLPDSVTETERVQFLKRSGIGLACHGCGAPIAERGSVIYDDLCEDCENERFCRDFSSSKSCETPAE